MIEKQEKPKRKLTRKEVEVIYNKGRPLTEKQEEIRQKIKKEFLKKKSISFSDIKIVSFEKGYVIFQKYPKIKIPIKKSSGKLTLNMEKKILGGSIEFK